MERSLFDDLDEDSTVSASSAPIQPVRIPLDSSDETILAVARRWTEYLVAEDYSKAFRMLKDIPGRSWVSSAEDLRVHIQNYGSPDPIAGEPICKVTPVGSAIGQPWNWLPKITQHAEKDTYRCPRCRGLLEWELPLNGEWSDLIAFFNLMNDGGELVFVLAALRVP